MTKNFQFCVLLIMICVNNSFSQIDMSVQYERLYSDAGGHVIGLIIDAPVKSVSIGAGIQYTLLDDYRFLPVISLNPDGTIGKGKGIGLHLNSKYFFSERKGWFIEPSLNMSLINQEDQLDNGIFTNDRDQSYSVFKPVLSLGYLLASQKGIIFAVKSGYGAQFYSNVDEGYSQNIFQFSVQLGYRFSKKGRKS